MLEVEREELVKRAKALSMEETKIFLAEMPTGMLFDELKNRALIAENRLVTIEKFMKGGESA